MRARRRPYSGPPTGRRPAAFSLAELMIAVMLLGLGLLFIAAALPVGIDYTRRNLDSGDARAAGEEALALLRARVRTSKNLVAPGVPTATYHRADHIFRPRNTDGTADDLYEPLIKVRPLVMANVLAERDGNRQPGTPLIDPGEQTILSWLRAVGAPTTSGEVDVPSPRLGLNPVPRFIVSGPLHAPLRNVPFAPIRPTERVFPFVRPMPQRFDATNPQLLVTDPRRFLRFDPPNEAEWQQTLDRRIAWTAFYRRVSYRRDPGRDGRFRFSPQDPPDDVLSDDPLRYEFIVVVTRRPTPRHRFAVQQAEPNLRAFQRPRAVTPGTFTGNLPYGSACVAPVPWLVVMKDIEPVMRARQTYDVYLLPPGPGPTLNQRVPQRYLVDTFRNNPPARLTFHCRPEVGQLLPPGSILIPARNDWAPNALNAGGGNPMLPPRAEFGFVPSAPDALPIYRVIERPDDRTLIVENNGYYPWNLQDRWTEQIAAGMPFWVIPPPFVARDAGGQPIYEQTSPILAVVRQVVTLPELPDRVFGVSVQGGAGGGARP